jgi:N-terminal domain of anti-restriction factor ArdC
MNKRKKSPKVPTEHKKPEFAKLLTEALNMPGKLSDCYRMFHNYSFGNQILAMMQVGAEPINTYNGWQMLNRQVKKGAKAIELCMPFTIKRDKNDPDSDSFQAFGYRRNWFGLSQTEAMTGNGTYELPKAIPFNKARVLNSLVITEEPFAISNGNTQGYCHEMTLAINPVAKFPLKTLWHEIAHIMLGHTEQRMAETAVLPRNIKEPTSYATYSATLSHKNRLAAISKTGISPRVSPKSPQSAYSQPLPTY